MTPPLVVAVDGGNSKTDVALLGPGGELLSWVRGPGSALGPQRSAAVILSLAGEAAGRAGLEPSDLAAAHASCHLAGADLPWQVDALHAALAGHGVLGSVEVANDAWALLRLGAAATAPAVGVVCGAGLKCVARDGPARLEFPGLGWQSGDLSGGGDFLAREAVRVAARAEDGRGPGTPLRQAVCEHLRVPTVRAVAERLMLGTLEEHRLGSLAPLVLDHARGGDPVAASVVEALAAEVATLARAARRSLPGGTPGWTLALGGGLFADPAGRLLAAVRSADPPLAEEFRVRVVDAPPVIGAALLGLDRLAADVADADVARAFDGVRPQTAGGRQTTPVIRKESS